MAAASSVRVGAVIVALVAGSGCSLLTSLDGLSGSEADGGLPDAGDAGTRADAPGDGADGGGGDAGADVVTKYSFMDDFNRADTTGGVGNGWNEKAIAFRLSGGEAERFKVGSEDYRDSIASRPSAETVGDVEISTEFRFEVGGGGYAQIHARVQTGTLATPGTLDSYLLFRNLNFADGKTFTVARQLGANTFATLKDFPCSSVIGTSSKYRMRLRVTGTTPVELAAFVEVQSGAVWSQIGTATVTDDAANRIVNPGVVGFSAGNDPTGVFAYDNFSAQGL